MKTRNLVGIVCWFGAALIAGPWRIQADSITLTPIVDTSLFESVPDNNLGGVQAITAGNTATLSPTRALLKFDLKDVIPAGSHINLASLQLTVVRASLLVEPATFELHRVLVDWVEGDKGAGGVTGTGALAGNGEATWNSRIQGEAFWSVPGAGAGVDFVAGATAVADIGVGTALVFSGAESVADVQLWLDHPADNFGWLIKDQFESSATTARRFGSRELPPSAPTLSINYDPPLRIKRTEREAGRICLFFDTESGRTYALERREQVDAGDWTEVATFTAPSATSDASLCDAVAPTGNGFYRIAVR